MLRDYRVKGLGFRVSGLGFKFRVQSFARKGPVSPRSP